MLSSTAAAISTEHDDHDDDDNSNHNNDHQAKLFVRSSLSHFLIPKLRHTQQYVAEDNWYASVDDMDDDTLSSSLDPSCPTTAASTNPWRDILEHQNDAELPNNDDVNDDDAIALFQALDRDYQNRRRQPAFQRPEKNFVELLRTFDPQNPPQIDDDSMDRAEALERVQLWLECEAQQEAVLRYQKVLQSARDRKDYSSLNMVQKLVVPWIPPLTEAIARYQKRFLCRDAEDPQKLPSLHKFGPHLCALPAQKLAVIVAHEALMSLLTSRDTSTTTATGIRLSRLAHCVGKAVEDEVLISRLLRQRVQEQQQEKRDKKEASASSSSSSSALEEAVAELYHARSATTTTTEPSPPPPTTKAAPSNRMPKVESELNRSNYTSAHLKALLDEISLQNPSASRQRTMVFAIRKARNADTSDEPWSQAVIVQLGAALLQLLMEHCVLAPSQPQQQQQPKEPVFSIAKHWYQGKLRTHVTLHDAVHTMVLEEDVLGSLDAVTSRHKPMVVPPAPWKSTTGGGYRILRVDLMRYGCDRQREVLEQADLRLVMDGLNALSSVQWRVNGVVLDVAKECWERNIQLGTDIPSRTDLEVPPEPEAPPRTDFEKGTPEYDASVKEYVQFREKLNRRNRQKQKNMVGFGILVSHSFFSSML